MAMRSTRRSKRDNDSQLDFFTLMFGGLQAAAPQNPSNEDIRPAETPASKSPEPVIKPVPVESDGIRLPAVENFPVEEIPVRNENNYRITDTDKLGSGGLKTKCYAYLSAIELLKHLEASSRLASLDEKQILVRYVGWGGLPHIFDALNETWNEEREQLEKLLTPDELDSARATTLNAHYTSATIIRAMYEALQRFGFEQGRILEPACGIGHFIGLMPEAMHSRSQITGIEIDSVTARIGTTRSMEHAVRNLEEKITNLEQNIRDEQKRIAEYTSQASLPFEYTGKLSELMQRQQEIAEALDLTKNQAPSQLESEIDEDVSVASEQGAVALREMGFPDYE